MAALRINLRILWNLIMKNFQVKHGQCDSILFLKTFSLENPKKLLLNLFIADSRILYFWQVLESTFNFIIEFHVLYYLFVKDLIKNKGGVGLFQISQKERLFHLLWQPSVLGDNLTMWSPFLRPSKKGLSSSIWARR